MTEPGKFEGCEDLETAERLYDASMSGLADAEYSAQGSWAALIGDAIAVEDTQGFFGYTLYGSEAEARAAWDRLMAEVEANG